MRIITHLTSYLKSSAWFLILLPVFFILSGYNELFGFLSLRFVLFNFFIILLSISLLFLLSMISFRNKEKSAIFTLIVSLPTLTFGYIHDSLKSLVGQIFYTSFTFLIPILLFAFIILLFYIKKRKNSFKELFLFFNLLFIILILSEIPNSIKRYKLHQAVQNRIDFRFTAFNDYHPTESIADSAKPDIYFLLFDAMASSKSLLSQLNFDNTHLDTFLSKKGFYVAANAQANYNWTIHSISTTFNMEYLPDWIAPVMNDPKVYFWGSSSILDNSLFRILTKEGYTIKSYQPISFDNPNWPADNYFSQLRLKHYYYKTLPGRIWRDVFWNYSKINIDFIKKKQANILDHHMLEKKSSLDTTISLVKKSCSRTGGPRFVYGHFMIPHEAYFFNENGSLRKHEEIRNKEKGASLVGYAKQVQYASSVIKDLVTYIQQTNRPNTVIIVAGDHGYRTEEGDKKGYTFQTLNAFYFYDHDYSLLYDSVSSINTFRIVLNKYIKTNFALLKDSSILVTGQNEAYKKEAKK